jgi:hypothetical protein
MLARQFGFDEAMVTPASYKIANMSAPRSPLLSLRCEKLVASLPPEVATPLLSGQESAMQRFVELYRHGYPGALHAALVEPNPLANPGFSSNG